MSRSAEVSRAALLAAIGASLVGFAGTTDAVAVRLSDPSPYVASSPAADPAGVAHRVAPILDLDLGVTDIVAPIASLDGCSSEAVVGQQRQLTLAADVLFAFDRSALAAAAIAELARVAATLRVAHGEVRIDGYTDAVGAAAYNQMLSEQRARAVQTALAALLPKTGLRFVAAGHGAANPVAANAINGHDYPPGRAKNRRVTITFGR